MATIYFNDKTYVLKDGALNVAESELRNHLSTVMNGTGAVIRLGNVDYNVDVNKLNAAAADLEVAFAELSGSEEPDVPVEPAYPAAGLYQTGAIALYEEQGADAIEGMLIKSWDDLTTEEAVRVEDGTVYGKSSSDKLNGDLVIGENVTTIGNSAFSSYTGLTSIMIPNSVTNIDSYAFEKCTGLTSITVPNSVTSIGYYPFKGCTELVYNEYDNAKYVGNSTNPYVVLVTYKSQDLTSCNICEGTKIICADAFLSCSSLESVTIPSSVVRVGGSAFKRCSSLTSVYITDIEKWCNISFETANANPLCYAGNLYLNGELITNVVIPESITTIGRAVFYNCLSLTSITIPNSVTSIDENAFGSCTGLTSIIIPDSVTSIGTQAFKDCSNLTYVEIPDSVTSIGNEAFLNCTNIIEKQGGVHYVDNWLVDCDSTATSASVRSDIRGMSAHAFYSCYKLTSVTLPNGITSITSFAFFGCSNLPSITIPNSVTSIGSSAFANCSALKNITFNGTVEQWNAISKTDGWNSRAPATYVQCADGQVAL